MKARIARSALTVVLVSAVLVAIFAWLPLPSMSAGQLDTVRHMRDIAMTPPGRLISDTATGLPAVMPLTMNFVRSPDTSGPDGKGRYLLAVNSGFGVEFTSKSKGQQTLAVIDLNRRPEPQVVENVYFPAPQSANFGLVFDQRLQTDGRYLFYLAGGFDNRIWIMGLDPKAAVPVTPVNKPDEPLKGPAIDVSLFASNAPSPNYNDNTAAVYPTGLALSADGQTLYSANNLGDSLGVIRDVRNERIAERISMKRAGSAQFTYPYDVKLIGSGRGDKLYVSLWGDGSVAVVDRTRQDRTTFITVGRHPTAMLLNKARTRLYVVNSDGDSVSVIDPAADRVIETINVHVAETPFAGVSPEGIALSPDEKTLYVTDAHANAVAIVQLAAKPSASSRSKLLGLIPTGKYPSAIAVVGSQLFVANGKGTGMENSSMHVTETGFFPNMPNKEFPAGASNRRGMYSAVVVSGNVSLVTVPDEKQLFAYTQSVMKNAGLIGREKREIFPSGRSPFKHVLYIIRENRTYDQVFGDLKASGDGTKADGDPSVAIFGAGETARSPKGEPQSITPNARALALRFGLLDRFFVNAEASPDGHNWSTAAFSNDYIDKAFRWDYSGRGRTYDYEGFNRLPSFGPPAGQPPVVRPPVFNDAATLEDVINFQKKYVPYYNRARDVGEPQTLYLWDAAQRAGLSYRNYGEFVSTISADDVKEIDQQKSKIYPDVSPNAAAFAVKRSLEGHLAPQHRNFDTLTPDIMSTDSYRTAKASTGVDPAIINANPDTRFRGNSRFNAWQEEFRGYVSDLKSGKGDHLPNLSIIRFSNDHTAGLHKGTPTPQFYVAENDYAIGRFVEEVSKSPYWADTAIFVVEDDAQDGPDHVDAHRSPGFVISAYNRPGALVHEMHSTVSLIRTLELCLGLAPMNFLDANATPIDIFSSRADLRPYDAVLPTVALDNLYPPDKPSGQMAEYMRMTERQDLSHPDMANPREMNEIIWFSVRGSGDMPGIARLPAFDLLRLGLRPEESKDTRRVDDDGE